MAGIEQVIFFSFLALIFLFEGLGLPNGRTISLYLILSFTPVMFLLRGFAKKPFFAFPKEATLLFSLFLIFTLLSLFFSLDIKNSIPLFLLYIACFLLFVLTYSYKENLKNKLIFFIIIFAVIFSLYSTITNILIAKGLGSSVLTNSTQFVRATAPSHNHLGDFLLLAITICLYLLVFEAKNKLKRIRLLLLITLFLPFFVFSYSRSAYLDLSIISLGIFLIYFRKAKQQILIKLLISSLFFIPLFLIFATTNNIKNPLLTNSRESLSRNFNLGYKDFLGFRTNYLSPGLYSIIEKPLLGVGPGNYVYASKKYGKEFMVRRNGVALNIFWEIITTNGIIAGIFFILFIFSVFKNFSPGVISLAALAMLLNFQTDYTYAFYSFFLLFFILMGLFYKEPEAKN